MILLSPAAIKAFFSFFLIGTVDRSVVPFSGWGSAVHIIFFFWSSLQGFSDGFAPVQ